MKSSIWRDVSTNWNRKVRRQRWPFNRSTTRCNNVWNPCKKRNSSRERKRELLFIDQRRTQHDLSHREQSQKQNNRCTDEAFVSVLLLFFSSSLSRFFIQHSAHHRHSNNSDAAKEVEMTNVMTLVPPWKNRNIITSSEMENERLP